VEPGEERAAVDELASRWPGAALERDDAGAVSIAQRIWRPAPGSSAVPLRLAVPGTNFQLKVWQALLELGGQGRTTYAAIAEAIGATHSSRAVGNAVGANPVGWLIPCHNVLRKDGALGGYRWGEDRKRAILAWDSLASAGASYETLSRSRS
jgi:AraC family transcriptional regulator of adaptative response/methylated-DNA-[protein]-cysteine methyltransferase